MQVTSLPEIFDRLRRQLTRRSISNSVNRRSGKTRRDDDPITWGGCGQAEAGVGHLPPLSFRAYGFAR